MQNESIVLIGMAGVGKSTVGRLLSYTMKCGFIDVDDYIEERAGKKLQDIVDTEGEEVLLEIEKRRMYEIDLSGPSVIAPGGSIIYHPDLMEHLKRRSVLIYLADSFETIKARLGDASRRGIIGLKSKTLKELHEERKPLYSRWADITLDCCGKSPETIVEEIIKIISQ